VLLAKQTTLSTGHLVIYAVDNVIRLSNNPGQMQTACSLSFARYFPMILERKRDGSQSDHVVDKVTKSVQVKNEVQ